MNRVGKYSHAIGIIFPRSGICQGRRDMSANNVTQALTAAAARLLKPLVKVLLRNGIPYRAFADIARQVYVEVAEKEFALPGRAQTVSRISTITGLTRKEVTR